MFLIRIHPTAFLLRWSDALARPSAQTVLRLPLFAAYLVLLAGLALEIRECSSVSTRASQR
jgi:hypothetical protein